MKKALSFALALLLIVSLIGCGAQSKPEAVVNKFCSALKAFDTETASACFESEAPKIENPYSKDAEANQDLLSAQALEYLKACAAKMTYTIGESKIDGNTAKVPVTFTYVDASPVITAALGEYLSQAFALAFSNADDADMESLFGTIFLEKTESVKAATATTNLTLTCVKIDNDWKLKDLDDAAQAQITTVLTCNISSALAAFNEDDSSYTTTPETLEWHDVKMGQELELATIKLRITACKELTELTAQYYEPDIAKSGTKFVIFSVDIENITKDTLDFNNDLQLVDNQERTYQPYSNAMWYYDNTFSYTNLAPNIKESGSLIYNVPSDAVGYYLTVQKADTNEGYRLYAN